MYLKAVLMQRKHEERAREGKAGFLFWFYANATQSIHIDGLCGDKEAGVESVRREASMW